MRENLVTDATVEPITLAEVKENLGIPDDDTVKDSEIEDRIIPSARKRVERYLGRSIISQQWKLTLDYFPSEIQLQKNPVSSIDSVKYYDTDGILQTISASNYYLDATGAGDNWLMRAYDYSWPDTQYRANAVEVTYTSGEATALTVDPEIKTAIHLIVGFYVNHPKMAESGLGDSRQVNWILRDAVGHLREVHL